MSDPEKNVNPLQTRVGELRVELEKGRRHLELLDQRRQEVRETLLRISGAIQVLEELLNESSSSNGDNPAPESEDLVAPSEASPRIAV